MHSVLFHFPFSPRLYEITSLTAPDVLSICNPLFQIRADYTFIQLTRFPVDESLISFEWEQTSGTTAIELSGVNTPVLTVLASSDVLDDLTFRVYIDRGTEFEVFADVTAFRTPTSTLKMVKFENIELGVSPLKRLGTNGVDFSNNIRTKGYIDYKIVILPDVLNGLNKEYSENLIDSEFNTVVISYKDAARIAEYEVLNLQVINPLTGEIVAASNMYRDFINIPKNLNSFYLVFEIQATRFNTVTGQTYKEKIVFSDSKITKNYVTPFPNLEKQINLSITQPSGLFKGFVANSDSVNNFFKEEILPASVRIIQSKAQIEFATVPTAFTNRQKVVFSPIVLDSMLDTKNSPDGLVPNKTDITNIILTRLNGISIGG